MQIKLSCVNTPEAVKAAERLYEMYQAYAMKKYNTYDIQFKTYTFSTEEADGRKIHTWERHVHIGGVPDGFLNDEPGYHRIVEMADNGLRVTSFIQVNVGGIDSDMQVRSYVLDPYTLAKDLRTGIETDDVDAVFRGELDIFYEQ